MLDGCGTLDINNTITITATTYLWVFVKTPAYIVIQLTLVTFGAEEITSLGH